MIHRLHPSHQTPIAGAFAAFALIAVSLLPAYGQEMDIATYQNPILERKAGADPAVLFHEGTFYLYTTNSALAVHTSTDLITWEQGPQVLPDHLKGAWAPEVYYHPDDGKFYCYYTMRYKIGVAVADAPDAMFEDLGFIAIPGIDAHPFRDDDGKLYLYFTHTPPFSHYVIPMDTPINPGGPVTKLFEVSEPWEKLGHPVNEGPWMLKRDGIYYLLFSGSSAETKHYAVGYATGPSPLGPFTKHPENPFFHDRYTILGPGHGSVARDRLGNLWHLYHQKTDPERGWSRYVCLDPIHFQPDNTLAGKPTLGVPQPVPAMDATITWTPEITPRGAWFTGSQTVAIASKTPGARIVYTLDGSEPTAGSTVYNGPFLISETTTVTARALPPAGAGAPTIRSGTARQVFTQGERSFSVPVIDGLPPFDVFAEPVKDWRPRITHDKR